MTNVLIGRHLKSRNVCHWIYYVCFSISKLSTIAFTIADMDDKIMKKQTKQCNILTIKIIKCVLQWEKLPVYILR